MLKTNSKKVFERVQNYIIESLEASTDLFNPTEAELLAAAVDWYFSGEARPIKYYGAIYYRYEHSFADFLTNSAIMFTPWYEEERELLKNWLEETEEEANTYTDQEVSRLFIRLLDRELKKLLAKNGIVIIYNESQLINNNNLISLGA